VWNSKRCAKRKTIQNDVQPEKMCIFFQKVQKNVQNLHLSMSHNFLPPKLGGWETIWEKHFGFTSMS
jgi:hypothetical protein